MLPFGRIRFAYGQPLLIESTGDTASLQQAADMLTEKLNQLEASLQ